MAKSRVAGVTVIKWDASVGGALTVMSPYVDSISAVGRAFANLDVTGFADSAERIIVGIEESQEFTIEGAYDDAATTGPDDILATAVGGLLSFEYSPIGTASGDRKFNCEVLVLSYMVVSQVKERINYATVFKMDGSMTVGAN